MGIGIAACLALVAWLCLYGSGRCSRLALELGAVAALVGLAGYAWQGRPDLDSHRAIGEPAP